MASVEAVEVMCLELSMKVRRRPGREFHQEASSWVPALMNYVESWLKDIAVPATSSAASDHLIDSETEVEALSQTTGRQPIPVAPSCRGN
jgi:hypothetical protein